MIRRTRSILITVVLLAFGGCDPAYRYVFYPEEREEYTLLPDVDLLEMTGDSLYSVSKDSLSVIYDRRTFKVEVKYLSDYQLNTTEFPDDSKEGEFSANPFTYGNWVDPEMGYTPRRFSVFKVSIYNYTSSKINFDPEQSFLVTDRGDLMPGYGREEKTSKNQSIESYFRKRKGSSGVDDEVFERRMGIVRTTVLYLGKPIYQGDSREGLVVYDPLPESVEKVKMVLENFITGYDENSEPSELVKMRFYFHKARLVKESIRTAVDTTRLAGGGTESIFKKKQFDIVQLRYRIETSEEGAEENWNSKPNALPSLVQFLRDSLRVQPQLRIGSADAPEIVGAPIAFLLAGPAKPMLGDVDITTLVRFIQNGGLLVLDNAVFSSTYQYPSFMQQALEGIASRLGPTARVQPIPKDHELYRTWKRLDDLPEGMDNIENMPDKREYLQGLFLRNRLVAVGSTKGYCMMWDKNDPRFILQFSLGADLVAYALRNQPSASSSF